MKKNGHPDLTDNQDSLSEENANYDVDVVDKELNDIKKKE